MQISNERLSRVPFLPLQPVASASPLALLAATCSKIGKGAATAGSASEYGPATPLAESLVARTISKSLEEERRKRRESAARLHGPAGGAEQLAAGLVQVSRQSVHSL